jgi:hypothetical protein
MDWRFWRRWTKKPATRTRAKMGRTHCPVCHARVAFSSHTLLTARHRCQGDVAQRPIDLGSVPHA